MKSLAVFFAVFAVMGLFNSCSHSPNTETANREASLKIEGMTCQMGCANTIQARLQKMTGVSFAEVDFENEMAIVRFNNSQTSEKEIKATINALADGAYKVVFYEENELESNRTTDTNPETGKQETSVQTVSAPFFDLSRLFDKLVFFIQ